MKRTEDEDEVLTFRRVESETPGSKLEEVVSAAILRCAKEKCQKRGIVETQSPRADNAGVKKKPVSSGNESLTGEAESLNDEGMELDETPHSKAERAGKRAEKTFKPAVAIDDDVSYEIIRPSSRAVLEQLDRALTILHNARTASAENPVDPKHLTSSDDEDIYDEATPSRRSRSRAHSRASSTGRSGSRSMSRDGGTPTPKKKKSNRGRKAASAPREGESERDFLIRRAKEQKKKRPVFSDDEGGGMTTAAENAKSPRRRRRRQRSESTSEAGEFWMNKKLDRFHLRGWSDVMGAAALAGFSPRVVERATQRCANLFLQGMEMHTIADDGGVETRRYVPGAEVPSSEDESEDEDPDVDLHQARSISRMSSAAPSRAVSSDEDEDRGRVGAPRKRQKRSHSRATPVTRLLYCPHADCERASRAFDRPYNLRRHLKAVHGEEGGLDDASGEEDESPTKRQKTRSSSRGSAMGQCFCPHGGCERAYVGFDRPGNLRRHMELVHGEESVANPRHREAQREALLGGVHRDGFLEPVCVQKGWRTQDAKKRAKGNKPRKRRGDTSVGQDVSESEVGIIEESPSGSES